MTNCIQALLKQLVLPQCRDSPHKIIYLHHALSSLQTSQNSVRRLPTDCGYSGMQQISISMQTFQIK